MFRYRTSFKKRKSNRSLRFYISPFEVKEYMCRQTQSLSMIPVQSSTLNTLSNSIDTRIPTSKNIEYLDLKGIDTFQFLMVRVITSPNFSNAMMLIVH